MNQGYPQGGLASLLASQGRGEDKVLVHMTPGEVQGLQAIALASGGSLTVNPQTGLPEAGWLKNLIPAIAGFTLNRVFPGLGSTATSAIVGAATGLIEGSVKKGLNAGFSAYSGSNISEGLRRAAAASALTAPKTLSEQLGLKESELLDYGDLTKPLSKEYEDFGVPVIRPTTPMPAVAVPTQPKADTGIWSGIKGLMTEKGREAFKSGLEGGYTSPFGKAASKYATTIGLQTAMMPDYDEEDQKSKRLSKPRYYIPGAVNPKYGQGYGEWYFQPGYYSDTYPGYAEGGMVSPGDEVFADGGEVMVSPGAVLSQPLSVYNPPEVTTMTMDPQFTQDREGLKAYYESLLVPPDTTPRDTSALKNYLDELRNRLKTPYKSSGPGWEFSALPTGPAGGTGGTSSTPEGNDPFATGVTGTPIDFTKPTTPPPQTTPPKEELTPPSSVAPGARPEDLGFLFGTPGEFPTEPPPEDEKTPGIEITAEPGTTTEDYMGQIGSISGPPGAGGLPPIVSEPKKDKEKDTETSIEVFDPKNIASDYAGAPASVAPPIASSPPPSRGIVSVNEQPIGTEFVELGFTNPPSTQKIGDESKSVVDDILKDFDEQQKAEAEKKKQEMKDLGMAALTEIAKLAVPGLGTILEIKKAIEEKKAADEKKATVKIETDEPVEEEKEEEKPAEPPASTGRTGGGFSPFLPSLSQERFGLAKAAGDDVFGPNYSGTIYDEEGNIIEENTDYDKGFAGGGYVPGYAQGGIGSLQQFAVGGKLVNGAGDGMSDDIKANINGTQEARLADGEFVIPADVVSHLGNGSTDAGAKQLYAMMDRIRKVRTGRERQAPEVNPRNYMPA